MKKTILLVALLGLIALVSGCALLAGTTAGTPAYRAGRTITVAYLLRKSKMSAKDVAAVEAIHQALTEVTATVEAADLETFHARLKAKLRELIDDDLTYVLADQLLEPYWAIVQPLIASQVDAVKQYKVLQDFQRGIVDARKEYVFLL